MATQAENDIKFPWDKVGANTLRLVVRDIGLPSSVSKVEINGSRAKMVDFLQDLERNGYDEVMETYETESKKRKLESGSSSSPNKKKKANNAKEDDQIEDDAAPSPKKRGKRRAAATSTSAPTEDAGTITEDGVRKSKRTPKKSEKVRAAAATSNAAPPNKSASRRKETSSTVAVGTRTPKAGRKRRVDDTGEAASPKTPSKKVLDGVVLVKRKKSSRPSGSETKDIDAPGGDVDSEMVGVAEGGDADAEGEPEVQQGSEQVREGDANSDKENQEIQMPPDELPDFSSSTVIPAAGSSE